MLFKSKALSPFIIVIGCIAILDSVFFVYSCSRKSNNKVSIIEQKKSKNLFVGSYVCKSCHLKEYHEWKKSDHFHAMARANDSTVRGNFHNVTIDVNGMKYLFYKKNGNFMVHAPGSGGRYREYKIAYTFGWTPLQQYLVRFPKGKLQALTIAWDVNKKKWFSLYPNQKITPKDWLFWTHGAMNWNTMCADCHSTNLKQNFIAKSDSFHTTWSGINVSCESCHGPGEKHVKYMRSLNGKPPDMRKMEKNLRMISGISSHKLVDECARCHSLREQLRNSFDHNGSFMDSYNPQLPHPDNYFPDGQIKQEDYVYGSFLQSKMYHYGISCTNCHNPHTMHLKLIGNKLCTSCHDAHIYDTPGHYHHKMNTKASLCINCHMPGRYYMQVDFRRDHSFRIPRPDLTIKYGTPNACNNCHKGKSAQWAMKAIKSWKMPQRDHFYDFTEILAKAYKDGPAAEQGLIKLVENNSEPAIARATSIWYLGQFLDPGSVAVLQRALKSHSSLVRVSAVNALSGLPSPMRLRILKPLINDSVRAVRVAAAEALPGLSVSDFSVQKKAHYLKAERELKKSFYVIQNFPAGQMDEGEYYEKKQDHSKAIRAYQEAIIQDPHYNPARLNLAYLYNQLGNNNKAEQLLKTVIKQEPGYGPAYFSLGLLVSQDGNLREAVVYFKKAVKRMSNNARVLYNEAIAYQKLENFTASEKAYEEAIKRDPKNVDYQFGILTLYMQHNNFTKALSHARLLVDLEPNNRRYQQILQIIESKLDQHLPGNHER